MTAHKLPPAPPPTSPEEKARRFGELMAAALQRIDREKAGVTERPGSSPMLPNPETAPLSPVEALSRLLAVERVRQAQAERQPAALSVDEAARYIGVSRRTMYRISAECGTGDKGIPVVHVKGRRVFRRVDLDAYLERNIVRGGRRDAGSSPQP